MDAPIPPELARSRATLLADYVGDSYNGFLHFGWTNAVSLTVIGAALSLVEAVHPVELLTVPLAFVFANLTEYVLHRHPMHHRTEALALLFDRHTLHHHRYFQHDSMHAADQREYKMVLFPWWAVVALAVLVPPLGIPLWWLFGPNVAALFVATGMAYFVLYEWLHLAYHLDPEGPIGRLPGMHTLREHHRIHHDPKLMTTYNFNVHFPLADWVFRTVAPEDVVR